MNQETKRKFTFSGDSILSSIKKLIQEGNIRKITITHKNGQILAEFPLTVGVIGTAFLPTIAAISTIVALVAECSITVEREIDEKNVKNEENETDLNITT